MKKLDLHMHSIVSNDGEFTPEEIVDRAIRLKMDVIAISDHDAVSAIEKALLYSKDKPLKVIPAIELSAETSDGTGVHIVGYNIDYKDKRFIQREKEIKDICRAYADKFMDSALNVGFKFDKENVRAKANNGIVTEEMIGVEILKDPRNNDDLRLIEYRDGKSKSDNPGFNFYKEFYSQGAACFIELPNVNLSIKEASDLIHSKGGFMVLAHPAYNLKRDKNKLEEIFSQGLDGIEVYSSYHTKEDMEYYTKEADRLGLIKTVGSDFHGKCKPAIEIGSILFDEEEVVKGLKKYIEI